MTYIKISTLHRLLANKKRRGDTEQLQRAFKTDYQHRFDLEAAALLVGAMSDLCCRQVK